MRNINKSENKTKQEKVENSKLENLRKNLGRRYYMENCHLENLSRFMKPFNLGGHEITLIGTHICPGNVNSSSTPHLHQFYEIHIPIQGAGEILVNNKEYKFSGGDFTITNPNIIHHWQALEPPIVFHIWWFSVVPIDGVSEDDLGRLLINFCHANRIVFKLPAMYIDSYQRLIQEMQKKILGYQYVVDNIIKEIFISFARGMVGRDKKHSMIDLGQEEQDFIVNQVDDFIVNKMKNLITLHDIASAVHISKRNLTRRYKQITGISIGRKIRQIRMNYAEELVRETEMMVKEVAYQCGFKSISQFSNEFFNFYKFTPTQYRDKMKKENTFPKEYHKIPFQNYFKSPIKKGER